MGGPIPSNVSEIAIVPASPDALNCAPAPTAPPRHTAAVAATHDADAHAAAKPAVGVPSAVPKCMPAKERAGDVHAGALKVPGMKDSTGAENPNLELMV